MNAIIRAGSAHDFLALVPALAGFHPRRSLVCVAFTGNRTAGVLRHDLPGAAASHEALVAAVVGTVCRMPDVDALVPIVYTDETFRDHGGMPERALLELVVDRAEQAGFRIRDALCRAGDAWGSALDRDEPATGHPLALIEQSTAVRHVPPIAQAGDQAGAMRPADPRTTAALAAAFDELGDIDTAEAAIARLGRFADPTELVETLLSRSRRAATSEHLAWFLVLASRPAIRDAMMLQIAFGAVMAELSLDAAHVSEEGGGQTPGRAFAVEELDDLLGRLVMGRTMLRPDRGRLERGLELLRDLVANAPESARPGVCCITAWTAWALGRGSLAGAFLDIALAIEPEHAMARLLDGFFSGGALPDWAFVRSDG
ncbi:hypothetical protein BJ978_002110 [Agromyces terreus]|uniref:DUF4192 family protein n=1 Tax=Agromyces terreus TaxID=424795 RepID=A0A9X2H7L4_9MICO|nr:DUF4192 family protein [Agromyces terreus]MCP2371434.1 hypothetical protein [Agromyces terreus]